MSTPQTADVRPFKGFIAIDGSHHLKESDAVAHSRQVKINNAITALAQKVAEAADVNNTAEVPGANYLGTSDTMALDLSAPGNIAAFLLHVGPEVVAAFNQDVRTRAPRRDAGRPRKQVKKVDDQQAAA